VVSTPMLREAIVQRELNGRWLLRYTDDHTEVVLQAKLLALVRRCRLLITKNIVLKVQFIVAQNNRIPSVQLKSQTGFPMRNSEVLCLA
jgi:hypothetical protein